MALDLLTQRLQDELEGRARPLFVGIDGRSGAGKSTLASAIAEELGRAVVAVIEGDAFYSGGSGESWDRRSAEEKAAHVIDWRRQADVLADLQANGRAEWFPFDWEASNWDSEPAPLSDEVMSTECRSIVILEGAYSCRPELQPLLDLTVLLDPTSEVRRAQLLAREGDAYRSAWEHRWSEAEDHYFSIIMPSDRFDLVLP